MTERNLDFDKVIDRNNTKCLKYDFKVKRGYPDNVLPLWVADMDFRTSSYIEDAIVKAAHHNIYGYINTQHGDGFFAAVSSWMQRHHNWMVKESWHVKTPGVCFAIATAINGLTNPGDAIIIQQPVYYPFSNLIRNNGRKMVSSTLVMHEDGIYRSDPEDFEKKIVENDVKLFILCNPHNPVGRVWNKEELEVLGNICRKHNVIVFSDEIHFDFIWCGTHHIFQEIDENFKDFTITATSPSKTFNLAGLQQANIFIPNEKIKMRFIHALENTGYDEPNIMGIEAAQAAYTYGDEWYEAMRAYVESNIDYAVLFVKEKLPGVKLYKPEGTYLIWLDFRDIGLYGKALDERIIKKAGLWLDSGRIFGSAGDGFQRINVACPRSVLDEAMERLNRVL